MKWVRQRCQDAPPKTVATASRRPWWASDALAEVLPAELRAGDLDQSAIPRIARDPSLLASIEQAVQSIPTWPWVAFSGGARRRGISDHALGSSLDASPTGEGCGHVREVRQAHPASTHSLRNTATSCRATAPSGPASTPTTALDSPPPGASGATRMPSSTQR